MALVKYCQHCNNSLDDEDAVSIEDKSYHKECYKCYICDSTNLKNSELFKGIIFCEACSIRIFRNDRQIVPAPEVEVRRQWSVGPNQRAIEETIRSPGSNMLTVLQKPMDLGPVTNVYRNTIVPIPHFILTDNPDLTTSRTRDRSVEKRDASINTHVSKNMLKYFNNELREHNSELTSTRKLYPKRHSHSKRHSFTDKEYEKSSEIMGSVLKNRLSKLQKQVEKSDENSKLPAPLQQFKKNILDRSSIVEVMQSENGDKKDDAYREALRKILYENLDTDHFLNDSRQDNNGKRLLEATLKTIFGSLKNVQLYAQSILKNFEGETVRKLYKTIKKNKSPYELGWLNLKKKSHCCVHSGDCPVHPSWCRHYLSKDYRKMRRKAMKLAGPTKSELYMFFKNLRV